MIHDIDSNAVMSEPLPDIPGYTVETELGRGGMGVVYRVRREKDGIIFALKMLLCGRGSAFQELARFRVEAEALGCLNHPNIIKIRDFGLYKQKGIGFFDDSYSVTPYFVMDFAECGNLQQGTNTKLQSPRQAAELVRAVAGAIQHAHDRRILHRDLKPANVLLAADGTPVVTDFGLVKFADRSDGVIETYGTFNIEWVMDKQLKELAKRFGLAYQSAADLDDLADHTTRLLCRSPSGETVAGDDARLRSVQAFVREAWQHRRRDWGAFGELTREGAIMGSPSYMAPEQAAGDAADQRTDVYALGGILYELLTGLPPTSGVSLAAMLYNARFVPPTPVRSLVPDVSADLELVCLKCLDKSPEQRYQTAASLADDLSRFLGGYSPRAAATNETATLSVNTTTFPTLVQPSPEPSTGTRKTRTKTWTWWPFGRDR